MFLPRGSTTERLLERTGWRTRVHGAYLPMITPCFQVRATDDAGNEHEGMRGDWRGFPGHEGSGTFWFWPPVPGAAKASG